MAEAYSVVAPAPVFPVVGGGGGSLELEACLLECFLVFFLISFLTFIFYCPASFDHYFWRQTCGFSCPPYIYFLKIPLIFFSCFLEEAVASRSTNFYMANSCASSSSNFSSRSLFSSICSPFP